MNLFICMGSVQNFQNVYPFCMFGNCLEVNSWDKLLQKALITHAARFTLLVLRHATIFWRQIHEIVFITWLWLYNLFCGHITSVCWYKQNSPDVSCRHTNLVGWDNQATLLDARLHSKQSHSSVIVHLIAITVSYSKWPGEKSSKSTEAQHQCRKRTPCKATSNVPFRQKERW